MPVRKMRVKMQDENGDCYTITFEGPVTREKAVHLLDLAELLGVLRKKKVEWPQQTSNLSKYGKTRLLIERNFPQNWFSSKDIQSAYEKIFKEPIQLSTVSTYLSRMTNHGFLMKTGGHRNRRYRMVVEDTIGLPAQVKQNKSLLTMSQKVKKSY